MARGCRRQDALSRFLSLNEKSSGQNSKSQDTEAVRWAWIYLRTS